ncbi:unnamed protein product, partial [Adineta steineri]
DEYNCKKNANQVSNEGTEQMEVTTTTKNKVTKRKSNKRKRMSTSISLRSITQPVPKKIKRKNISTINPMSKQTNYRLPKYLKKSSNILFQSLRLQLEEKLNTKVQQRFLHYRLQLIDQQHRLNLHQDLWQSYRTLGCEQQIWPNQVYKLAKTNQHELCQDFVSNRLTEFNQQFDQCTTELLTQSQSCPSKLLPIDELDKKLKEFVSLEQKYLS